MDFHNKIKALVADRSLTHDLIWLRVGMEALPSTLRAGWKLHISLPPQDYEAQLVRLVPLLAELDLPFKVAASTEIVELLHEGALGLTQVGKSVTIYPASEAEAYRIAQSLTKTLKDFRQGPQIPGDQRYSDAVPIYFRYGPYDGVFRLDAMGRSQRVLRLPDGREVLDSTSGGEASPIASTLFPVAAPYDHLAFLRKAYLFVRILQLTAKGGAFLAVSSTPPVESLEFIKTGRRGANADRYGRDALWALRREHSFLERMEGCSGFPAPGELLSDGEEVIALVRPYLEGDSFWEHWSAFLSKGPSARMAYAKALQQLGGLVHAAHEKHLMLRDLSPGNILLSDHQTYMLDLELAHDLEEAEPAYRRGTLGFYKPDQERFAAPEKEADYYALLALAFMAHAGVHPAWLQEGLSEVARGDWDDFMAEDFAANWKPAWEAQEKGRDFFQAWEKLIGGLAADPGDASMDASCLTQWRQGFEESFRAHLAGAQAGRLDYDESNLYSGLAGLIVFCLEWDEIKLAEFIEASEWAQARQCLARAGSEASEISGLYFGASGIALALLGLGEGLEDQNAVAQGKALLLNLAWRREDLAPDLCHGLAGYIQALLGAHRLTQQNDFLDRAREVGDFLLEQGQERETGLCFPWPEGPYGELSGAACFGFGHGSAGVAAVWAQLYQTTGEARFLAGMEAGLAWLRAGARRVEGMDATLWWPYSESDESYWNAWCHGAPGIVKAFSAALKIREKAEDRAMLIKALNGIRHTNNGSWCLCHGVASRLDAYTDAYAVLSAVEAQPFRAASERDAALLAKLSLYAAEALPGAPVFNSAPQERGLMTGATGVFRSLLRYHGLLHGRWGQLLP